MADRVELAFRHSAVELIPDGASVVAAVSGGGDSVALLHLLRRYARPRRIQLSVAHLDHALRRGSRADRAFVERLSRELGLACVAERQEVALLRRRDESPEEAARRVRRAFLQRSRKQLGAELIATGHTLDDQAETVLMRLVRGAGATALTGMAARGPGPFVRPLLGLERDELRAYLERRGLAHREDPSNRSLRFDRNRVRRRVLPLLAEALNPRAARHLVRAAQRFRDDALHLDQLARRLLSRLVHRDDRRGLALDARRLAASPPALAKRVARLALQRAGCDPRRLGTGHVEALLDLARGGRGRQQHLPSGVTACRQGEWVVLKGGS